MKLNVLHGFVSPSAYYVPFGGTVGALMAAADAQLAVNAVTVATGANRTAQGALKTWLDQLNNGAGVVSGSICAFSF